MSKCGSFCNCNDVSRPYYKDLELSDYLRLQLEGKGSNDGTKGKKFRKSRPPKTDGEIVLAALKQKTQNILKPAVNKLTNEIPSRLTKGWERTFGTRRQFSEADLDDTYYYDDEGEADDKDQNIYEYYAGDKTNDFNDAFYVTDDVISFPNSKSKNSNLRRISKNTADLNYDYNYDYVQGNYPSRIPRKKKKKPGTNRFDTSRFYK